MRKWETRGVVKGDIVPSSGEEGCWSPGEMASLQHEWASVSWGGWGEAGALCPALLDPTTKASLIPFRLLSGGDLGGLDPNLALSQCPKQRAHSGNAGRGVDKLWGIPRNALHNGQSFFFLFKNLKVEFF